MKKILKMFLALFIILLFLQIISVILKQSHKITYSLKTEKEEFLVTENFHDKTLYDFIITTKNKDKFVISIDKNYYKQKNIVKDLKIYKKNDVVCLYPIYKKTSAKKLFCSYDKKQVSLSYLFSLDNDNLQDFLKETLKKLDISYPKKSTKTSFSKINVYQENILSDYTFLIWNYKGLYILNSKENTQEKLLSKDKYENTLATLLDNYYIYIDTNAKNYSEIYIYDVKKRKKITYKIRDFKLSKRIYFNGIYNHELYITDLDTKYEYKFNPKKKKLVQVNKTNSYLAVKNKKLITLTKSEFLEDEVYFDKYVSNKKITKMFNTQEIYYYNKYYYFRVGNKIYKALENYEKEAILLFELDNIKEWKLYNGDLTIIGDDTFYFYNDKVGLLPIVESNELRYNYKNICHFWKKE